MPEITEAIIKKRRKEFIGRVESILARVKGQSMMRGFSPNVQKLRETAKSLLR